MPSAIQLAQGDPQLIAAIQRSRRLLGRKALIGAAASAVPLPGLDWAADAALLSRLVPQISAEFGLSMTQLNRLDPQRREGVMKAAASMGTLLVGKLLTRELLVRLAQHAGIRLTTKQVTKYVPLAGQAVSAVLGYAALRTLGELHIRECVAVARAAQHLLPPPASGAASAAEAIDEAPARQTRPASRLRTEARKLFRR